MGPTLRIIPSLLLSKGRLIKGKNFENHIDVGNPITTSKAFEAQGADEIFIIDLEQYKSSKQKKNSSQILRDLSKNLMTSITFGGGIKTFQKAKECLRSGADKIYLSSILFENLDIVSEISKVFGNQSIVCGINVIKKDDKYLLFENEKINFDYWLEKINNLPVGEIKITFVNLEGSKKGFDIKFCKKLATFFDHPLVVEGGIGNLNHIKQAAKTSISGLALGTILNFSEQNIIKIKQFLTNEKIKVRS